MFDKLSKLFDTPQFEEEGKPQRELQISQPAEGKVSGKSNNESIGKGILIGVDPFNRKQPVSTEARIQEKMELLKQLRRELGK